MFKFKNDGTFDFIDKSTCHSFVGTAVIGAGVLGAGATIYGANKAADAQTSAAAMTAANSKAMFDTTNANLAPYRAIGSTAADQLTTRLSDLTTPVSVNPQDFLNSDQYKFLQTQGERGVTNSSAARGLGTSGAALKGAAAFESGLNSSQWQTNFNNQITNQTNAYNRLKGLVDTGENAGAQTGVIGNASVGQQNAAITGGANATAAAANTTGGALSNLASNVGGYAAYKGLYGSTGTPSGPGSTSTGGALVGYNGAGLPFTNGASA